MHTDGNSILIGVYRSLSVVGVSIHRLDVGFFGEGGEAGIGEALAQLGELEKVFGELGVGEDEVAHMGEAAFAVAGLDEGDGAVDARLAVQGFELERFAIGGDGAVVAFELVELVPVGVPGIGVGVVGGDEGFELIEGAR